MSIVTTIAAIFVLPLLTTAIKCKMPSNGAWKLPERYSATEPGDSNSNETQKLYTFDLQVRDIDKVDLLQQTIQISMYFEVGWHEPSLEINTTAKEWRSDLSE